MTYQKDILPDESKQKVFLLNSDSARYHVIFELARANKTSRKRYLNQTRIHWIAPERAKRLSLHFLDNFS